MNDEAKERRWPWSAVAAAALAVLVGGAAVAAAMQRDALAGLFGPPAVKMSEAYEEKPGAPGFDHSAFDALLSRHVSPGGWVDYRGLMRDREQLQAYLDRLADAPFEKLGRDEKLALLINAYNAFTLELILEHYPLASIRDLDEPFEARRWQLAGETVSLNQIEHEWIRPNFKEPRIHFALVCAAVGCPPLRAEAYTADRLEAQLAAQAEYVHNHPRWFRYEPGENVVHLTELYNWYGGDFEQAAGSVLRYAARYAPALREALEAGDPPRVAWIDYDWSLNSLANAPQAVREQARQ